MKRGDILAPKRGASGSRHTATRLYMNSDVGDWSSYLGSNEIVLYLESHTTKWNTTIYKVLHSTGICWIYDDDVEVIQ